MKILNLYAGIGGNRKLWGNDHEITAVEINPQIAKIYQDFFPNDMVLVEDAHEYLLMHYKEYDFIWLSNSCISHSKARYWSSKGGRYKPVYPDMTLYQEIYFLRHFVKCKWVSENVEPYYEPLIAPDTIIDRHLFWSNFIITKCEPINNKPFHITSNTIVYGFDLRKVKVDHRKDQILRNLIDPELGLHILNCSQKETIQLKIF